MKEPKKYSVRNNIDVNLLKKNGFRTSANEYSFIYPLYGNGMINLILSIDKEDNYLSTRVEYDDNSLFAPFYNEEFRRNNELADKVIKNYNNIMDKLTDVGILERVCENKLAKDPFKRLRRIARFYKVSYEQFKKDWIDTFPDSEETDETIKNIYDSINIPTRSTRFSAGYDFKAPSSFTLAQGESIKIPTGIRCRMNNDYVLQIYPRSSLGFKYMFVPMNLVAIVDSDYYDSDNGGHIFMKMKNCGDKIIEINAGDAFCQGMFVNYGITEDDHAESKRNGGLGSTNKREGQR